MHRLLAEYLEDVRRKRSKATHSAYRSVLGAFFSRFDVGAFTAGDVDAFLEGQRGWSNQTRNYFLTVLGQFVDYLRANTPIPNPATDPKGFYEYSLRAQELERVKRISRYSVRREVERKALTLEELATVLEASEGDYPARFFIWCHAYFGLRRGELLGITLRDVDFAASRLDVRAAITKSAPRYFYFDGRTRRVLEDALDYYGAEGGRLFPVSPATPNLALRPYQKYVGPRLTTHALRHTFNTWMRETLKDDRLLKFLMGHRAGSDMSDYYTSVFEEKVRDAMLNRHYFNLLGR